MGYKVASNELLAYRKMLYIPNQKFLKDLILDEYHKSSYVGHPWYQNMIYVLRKEFFWHGMKKEVVEYLRCCLECQQIKAEH